MPSKNMPETIQDALREVLDYDMPTERVDYEQEGEPRGHVYEHLLALSVWANTPADALHATLPPEIAADVRDALEGDSNDAEHDALAGVAEWFGIQYTPIDDLED